VRPLRIVQVGGGFWAEELGATVFPRLEQAVEAVEADAALLVTPPQTHRPLGELALAHGWHVVSEKPLALDLIDARALAKAAARAGRHVMAAQNYRFRRQSRALQHLVSSGALGRLLGVRISCRRDLRDAWVLRDDWRGRMEHPYLLDMAIHHVDMLRQITGHEIAEVDARGWTVPDAPFRHEPTVEALITLDDGTPVAYEGTWAVAAATQTSWNGDWELVGERARATWTGGVDDALRGTVAVERYGSGPERLALPRLRALDRLGVLHELRRAIADGTEPECSAADNLKSLGAILAMAGSVERARPVRP
jgi:predicted dehydrogenase